MPEIVQNARATVKPLDTICAKRGAARRTIKMRKAPKAMMTPADRLRSLVERHIPEGVSEAAKRHGWNVSTFGSHVRGLRGIKKEDARKYAHAFGVAPGWLLFGEGDDKIATGDAGINHPGPLRHKTVIDSKRIPRLRWGMIRNTASIAEAVDNTKEYITLPGAKTFGAKALALDVPDNSMLDPANPYLGFRPGETLVFDADQEAEPGDFVLAVVDGMDVEVFRQYRRAGRSPDGAEIIDLVPLNPHCETYHVTVGVSGSIKGRLVYRGQTF
jgi:SOS-response transcriptional repressor LexA